MDGSGAGNAGSNSFLCLDQLLGGLHIHLTVARHTTHNASTAHRHVGVLMSQDDGGTDGMVSTASGVGAIKADNNGYTQLIQFSIAVERCTAAATIWIHLLLLIKLYTGAVEQIYNRNVQAFGRISSTQQILRLTRNPCASHLLVIKCNDNRPLATNAAKALDYIGRAVGIVLGVKQAIQRAPSAFIHQLADPLHSA